MALSHNGLQKKRMKKNHEAACRFRVMTLPHASEQGKAVRTVQPPIERQPEFSAWNVCSHAFRWRGAV